MENVRNRTNGHLLRDEVDMGQFTKLVRQPNYKSTTIFPECDLSFIEMYKTKTILNKPIYCCVSILDFSKTLMYDFYYNRLKREYRERVNLLYTDTDSLLLAIYTNDVYKDIKK